MTDAQDIEARAEAAWLRVVEKYNLTSAGRSAVAHQGFILGYLTAIREEVEGER